MTLPRHQLIDSQITPYYHCVSRCVRRAFLCGQSDGQNYEHRRAWVEKRMILLAQHFCIDVCAYAIMSNHYHLVLHINEAKANSLSDMEVCERWLAFHVGPPLIQKYVKEKHVSASEWKICKSIIQTWRVRLTQISWFMALLNQHIAREANKEEGCTGRFWEGRYKSQALLDEAALAAAMAYVDLNPIRAKMTKKPERSDHTSVKARIEAIEQNSPTPAFLFPFVGNPRKTMPEGLPFRLMDYLELVDWTGRIEREDKRGAIKHKQPSILTRLNIDRKDWQRAYAKFESKPLIGNQPSLLSALPKLKRRRNTGLIISTV